MKHYKIITWAEFLKTETAKQRQFCPSLETTLQTIIQIHLYCQVYSIFYDIINIKVILILLSAIQKGKLTLLLIQ